MRSISKHLLDRFRVLPGPEDKPSITMRMMTGIKTMRVRSMIIITGDQIGQGPLETI